MHKACKLANWAVKSSLSPTILFTNRLKLMELLTGKLKLNGHFTSKLKLDYQLSCSKLKLTGHPWPERRLIFRKRVSFSILKSEFISSQKNFLKITCSLLNKKCAIPDLFFVIFVFSVLLKDNTIYLWLDSNRGPHEAIARPTEPQPLPQLPIVHFYQTMELFR